VTPDEGLACVRRHLPSAKVFHPAGVRTRGGRRQDLSARLVSYPIAFAMANAAAAASPPTSAVCQALFNGFFTVKRPFT
jgi:hypothetical protein